MIFEIQGPDGKTYEVEAESMEQAAEAFQSFAPQSGGVSTDTQAVDEFGSKARAAAAGVVDGASLGFADEATGLVGGLMAAPGEGTFSEGYTEARDAVRGSHDELKQSEPGSYGSGQVVGGAATAVVPGAQAMRGGSSLMKTAKAAADGAIFGGLYGAGSANGGMEERLSKALPAAGFGAGAGLAARGAGAGIQKYLDSRTAKKTINDMVKGAQSANAQRAASGRQYNAFDEAGAEISPEAMTRLSQQLKQRLSGEGLGVLPGTSSRTPGGQQIVDTVGLMDDQVSKAVGKGQNPTVPLSSIEELRRFSGDVASDVNPIGRSTQDGRLGAIAIDEIDEFVSGLQKADIPIGDGDEAKAALGKARDLWSQASKTQVMENILEQQDNYLGGSASAIRNKVATVLRNPKTSKQFSDAEKELLRKIIGGNVASRTTRLLGNGIGRQMQVMGGGMSGGIPGAVAGLLTGELTGAVSNRNAVKAAEKIRDLISAGGIKEMPVANEGVRQAIEQMLRRSGAVSSQ